MFDVTTCPKRCISGKSLKLEVSVSSAISSLPISTAFKWRKWRRKIQQVPQNGQNLVPVPSNPHRLTTHEISYVKMSITDIQERIKECSMISIKDDARENLKDNSKVLLFLRPVGEASGLKKSRYKLDGTKSIKEVEKFLKKTLGMASEQSVFLYCGSGFSPTPDQNLQDLFDNFQIGGELVVNYGVQEVWG